MIEKIGDYEQVCNDLRQKDQDYMITQGKQLIETVEALRKALKQVPKVTVLEHGTDICSFCRAHPVDDHYAHCAYAALPDWTKE